ncbi:DNA polymerase [Clostridium butyricum]|uniref:DNA polymerase n=1 Tax=Clostridium butyricum TaxID=1492 RepID=UPI00374E9A21
MTKNKVIWILEKNGIKFDYTAFYDGYVKSKELEQALLADKIKAQLGMKESILDLDDTKQVVQALYKCNIYPESLSFEYLVKHRSDNEIYKLLLQYKNINQFLHLYRDKLKNQIGKDGRLHGKWSIDGAKTGRMTCSEPNLQGFPNSIKEFFVPEKENVFVIGDFSQIELRVLAEMSRESNMIRAFKEGRDIHAETAAFIFQKDVSLIDDGARELGKKVNFSQCYGVSSYGLRNILKKQDIEVTQEQAGYIRGLFYKKYPNIYSFHNMLLTSDVIRSIDGRTCSDIPKGDGKRLNLPIQASAAEGFKRGLNFLIEDLMKNPTWKIVNVIHDEVVLEVPKSDAKEAKSILENCMKKGMETILKIVPVIVDMKIQDNWKK